LRPAEPLVGAVVRVEPLAERHREGLCAAAADDPDIFRYTNFTGFDPWFDEALAARDEVPFVVFVGDREVGSTRFLAIAPEHRRAEIGWTWLWRPAWGTGANAETKLLLLEHAFEHCGLRRVEFKTHSQNERSRAALLALGARFEGVFRKHMILPTGSRDSAWYAITDDDWPSVKKRLLERLAERRSNEGVGD
jgi:RimJ/RimL family protein N-acetyltransferase